MTIATNADLKTWLGTASMRTDLGPFLQDFVNRAHAVIARDAVIYAPVTISAEAITLPDDFGQVHSLWILQRPMLQLVQVSQAQLGMIQQGCARAPVWFNIAAEQVGPTPDQTYEGRLLYRVSDAKLANDGDTNAILQAYPFAYVYGALAEIARFNFDDDIEQRREAMFQSEIENINQAELAKALAGAALQLTPSTTVA